MSFTNDTIITAISSIITLLTGWILGGRSSYKKVLNELKVSQIHLEKEELKLKETLMQEIADLQKQVLALMLRVHNLEAENLKLHSLINALKAENTILKNEVNRQNLTSTED